MSGDEWSGRGVSFYLFGTWEWNGERYQGRGRGRILEKIKRDVRSIVRD